MNKKELRIKYKAIRREFSDEQINEQSLEIANSALRLPIWDKLNYHVFLPIKQQNEVNTEFLLHLLSGKDKNIIVSKSNFETREMNHFLMTDNTKFNLNAYGIPEPVDGVEFDVNKIDVVFVPLLAFDLAGNRVGYGKGFYDRFLAKCRPETIKVGLSFFEAEESCSDVFESDVKLDFCVTPERNYIF